MAQFRSKPFGVTKSGEKVNEYIISNPGGLEVHVLNYGCVIKNILVPTKKGPVDVVVGHDTLADYENDFNSQSSTCCGAFVGRYANRIENAVFSVGGLPSGSQQWQKPSAWHIPAQDLRGEILWRYPVTGGGEPGWRRRVPRQSENFGAVYPHRGQCPADGLPGVLRRGHRAEPHQPYLF